MTKIEELLAKRRAAIEAAEALEKKAADESRDPTETEAAEIDAHLEESVRLQAEIEAAREAAKVAEGRRQRLQTAKAWEGQAQPRVVSPSNPTASRPGSEGGFRSFGQFLHAVRNYSLGNVRDPRLVAGGTPSGLNEGAPSEGGFLVQQDHLTELLRQVWDTGQIVSRCREVPVSAGSNGMTIPYLHETSRANGNRLGGVQGYWIGEAEGPTATKPKFGMVDMKLAKLGCLGYATDEMLSDSAAMENILMTAFAEEIAFVLENAILWGTGAGQPLGIMNAPCLVEAAKVAGQTADTVWGDNIVAMWSRLYAGGRTNAVWLYTQDAEPHLYTATARGVYGSGATDMTGIPLFLPSGSLLNPSPFATILGRPAIPCEHCESVGTEGDILLADFSQYLLLRKGGPETATSMHVRFVEAENAYRTILRTNGEPWWPSAVTPRNGGATLGPFVKLDER